LKVFTYQDYIRYQESKIINRIEETKEEYHYENDIYKKHDKLLKTILTKKEVSSLLKKYINIDVPEEDLEKYNNSYITKNYKERESDIVYKQKRKDIFFLIEHQSTIDYKMPFRILEYSVEIIREIIKDKKGNEELIYPQIVPIVIYTGNKKWNVKEGINQMQEELKGYSTEIFKYNLIDINNYTKEELLKENTMFSKIAVLEKCKTQKEMLEVLEKIIENTKNGKEELYRIINYIIRPKIGEEETEKILNKIKEKEDISMVAELFAKECDKYFEKGIKTGKKQAIIKMLKMKIDKKTIKEIYELSDEELEKIEKQIV